MKKLRLIMLLGGLTSLLPSMAFAYAGWEFITNNSNSENLIITRDAGTRLGYWHCPSTYGDGGGPRDPDSCVVPANSVVVVQLTTEDNKIHEDFTITAQNTGNSIHTTYYCGYKDALAACTDGIPHQFTTENANPATAFFPDPNKQGVIYQSNHCPDLSTVNSMIHNTFTNSACPSTEFSQDVSDTSGRTWKIKCSRNYPTPESRPLTTFKGATIQVGGTAGNYTHGLLCYYNDGSLDTKWMVNSTNAALSLSSDTSDIWLPPAGATNWRLMNVNGRTGQAHCADNSQHITDITNCQWGLTTSPQSLHNK